MRLEPGQTGEMTAVARDHRGWRSAGPRSWGRLAASRFGVLVLALFMSGCSSQSESPEEQVRTLISRAEQLAENRDLLELKELISTSYKDTKKRDRRAIVQMLGYYFLRNKSIHLLTRIDRIEFPRPDRAEMTLYVADMATYSVTSARSGRGKWIRSIRVSRWIDLLRMK